MNRKWIAAFVALAAVAMVVAVGRKPAMPETTLYTLSGETLALSQLRGRVVLVNFWATSCPSCLKEMPALAQTHRKFAARGYETVAVAMSYDPPEAVRAYVERANLPFVFALDREGVVASAFGDVRLTPTSFVIDRKGRIVWQQLGEPDFPWLDRLIEGLLAESP